MEDKQKYKDLAREFIKNPSKYEEWKKSEAEAKLKKE
jgi:hypothetical protein